MCVWQQLSNINFRVYPASTLFKYKKGYLILQEPVAQWFLWPEMKCLTPSSNYHGNFREPEYGGYGRSDGSRSRCSSLRKNAPNTRQTLTKLIVSVSEKAGPSQLLAPLWMNKLFLVKSPGFAAGEIIKSEERASVVRRCEDSRNRGGRTAGAKL